MTVVHKNIYVLGRVQGVFYRASAMQTAQKLNISGFVRNEPDGSVYVEAEGEEQAVQQFIKWCKTGSPAAKVTAVEVKDGEIKTFTDFQVERE